MHQCPNVSLTHYKVGNTHIEGRYFICTLMQIEQEDNIDKIDISCPDQILKMAFTKMNQDHAMSVLL